MFPVSNDEINGSAHQATPASPLLVTRVSPAYANIQCGLNRQDYPEFDLAVTGSSMPQWPQLTHHTPSILLPSFSGPVSSSRPKPKPLSRKVTTGEARLRAQQIRDFKLQNPEATQEQIASPSGLEYLMKIRLTLLTMSQVYTDVVERKKTDIRVFEGLR
jgi:hypothetical protein